MQYCVDHPEEISKLAKVKAQVSEVKGVMMENIEKVRFSASCIITQLEKKIFLKNWFWEQFVEIVFQLFLVIKSFSSLFFVKTPFD